MMAFWASEDSTITNVSLTGHKTIEGGQLK
jgi:hypothetical protein